jgi:hypothetical protein
MVLSRVSSLRVRLMILVSVAVVPAFVLVVRAGLETDAWRTAPASTLQRVYCADVGTLASAPHDAQAVVEAIRWSFQTGFLGRVRALRRL